MRRDSSDARDFTSRQKYIVGGASVDEMTLTDGTPGDASLMTGTLGGSPVMNNAPWAGKWTPIGRVRNGKVRITAQSTTAQVVRIRMVNEQGAE
jgi:hypothetical protein